MFTLMVFLFILLPCFILYKIRGSYFAKKINQFDGPPTKPFFGNSLMFPGSATDIYKTFISLNQEYRNQPYRMWFFHRAYVVIHYLRDARIVSKMPQKDDTYSFICDIVGYGLLTSSGNQWKKTRTLLDPHFNTRTLNDKFLSVFNDRTMRLLQELKDENKGTYFNLRPYIYRTAILSLYENIMGFSEENVSHDFEQFLEDKDKCCDLIVKRIYSPWLHPNFLFKTYLYATGQSDVFNKCRGFFVQAIQKKKQMRSLSKNLEEDDDVQRNNSIIDILMDSHNFSDVELTDEILTFLFAGTETTVSTICFTLLMLATYPKIQKAVFDEMYTVFGDSTRLPTATDLAQLTFLEQCIKETLRKFTIVPAVVRKVTTETQVADGRVIPTGTNIYLSIHGVHHSPDIYPNPDTWDPSNFDPDKIASRPANSFLPFGIGQRLCIGHKYAMLSMKATLTMIIRNFELATNQSDLIFDCSLVLKSKEGYFLKLTERAQ